MLLITIQSLDSSSVCRDWPSQNGDTSHACGPFHIADGTLNNSGLRSMVLYLGLAIVGGMLILSPISQPVGHIASQLIASFVVFDENATKKMFWINREPADEVYGGSTSIPRR